MNLVDKTIYGIQSFTLMLILLICTLANVLYILSKVDHDENILQEDGTMPRILTDHFDNDAVNAVIHMYLLSLGEFDFENFSSRGTFTQILLWGLFAFGTFLL